MTRFDPDYYPLQLGNHVLGGGFYATRLYHDLRQVTGYVYNVEVVLNAQKTRTIYTVAYGCDPRNVSKARQLIQRDLIAMQMENVSPGNPCRFCTSVDLPEPEGPETMNTRGVEPAISILRSVPARAAFLFPP